MFWLVGNAFSGFLLLVVHLIYTVNRQYLGSTVDDLADDQCNLESIQYVAEKTISTNKQTLVNALWRITGNRVILSSHP